MTEHKDNVFLLVFDFVKISKSSGLNYDIPDEYYKFLEEAGVFELLYHMEPVSSFDKYVRLIVDKCREGREQDNLLYEGFHTYRWIEPYDRYPIRINSENDMELVRHAWMEISRSESMDNTVNDKEAGE